MSRATTVWDDVADWRSSPGSTQFVYLHHGTEELLTVLREQPNVRMHDGDRQSARGRHSSLPQAPRGGHQFRNDGEETARVLIVAAHADPDVAEYPETGKVAAIVHGEHRYHRVADAVEHAGPE